MRKGAAGSLFFTVAGVGLIVASASWFWRSAAMAQHYERTVGTVVKITAHPRPNHPGQPIYYPTISFVGGEGETHTFEASIGSGSSPYRNNETVPVWYDAHDAGRAFLATFLNIWGIPLILLGLGTAFAALGTYAGVRGTGGVVYLSKLRLRKNATPALHVGSAGSPEDRNERSPGRTDVTAPRLRRDGLIAAIEPDLQQGGRRDQDDDRDDQRKQDERARDPLPGP